MVGGDTLVDAQPTFQNNEPVVSFRFDAAGAKRFGDATRDNVGKPFAIVLDNKVISAPVIREAYPWRQRHYFRQLHGPVGERPCAAAAGGRAAGAYYDPRGADGRSRSRRGFDPCRSGRQHRRGGAGRRVHDPVLWIVRRLCRYRADLQSMSDARQPFAARRNFDPAGDRRHRADHGHGGRRECPDL